MAIVLQDPAGPKRTDVLNMLKTICPEANLDADDSGVVTIGNADACAAGATPRHAKGCKCICELVRHTKLAGIKVEDDLSDEGGGRTRSVSPNDAVNGTGAQAALVGVENQNRWRTFDETTRTWTDYPDWAILAHELCGHALPSLNGNHPESRPGKPGYRENWHDQAFEMGDGIRDENGLAKTGTTSPWVKPKKCKVAFQPFLGVEVTGAGSSNSAIMTVEKDNKKNVGGFKWHCVAKGSATITVEYKESATGPKLTKTFPIECPE